MDVSIIEEENYKKYNKILIKLRSSPFISPFFVESLLNKNSKPIFLKINSGSKTIGLISGLVIESSYSIPKKLEILKYLLFYSGPSVANYEKSLIGKCISTLIEDGKREFCMIKFLPYDYPYQFFINNHNFHITRREEFIINLKSPISDIQQHMNKNIKSKINKSNRNNLEFDISKSKEKLWILSEQLDNVKEFRESRGYYHFVKYYLPYLSRNGIKCLLNSNIAKLFLIKKNEEILSIQLILVTGKKAYAILHGTNTKGYKLGANAYIFYRGAEYLKSIGVTNFNIGGYSTEGKEGMIFFKTGLGAERYFCYGGEINFLHRKYTKKILKYHKKWKKFFCKY
jgi:hypothetical protein